ncbi:MAG: endonuclease domain-containing protein [Rhizomicrobium sp.]
MVKAHTELKRDALAVNRSRAKSMRPEPVVMEELFWSIARNRQLGRFKFKRQVLIGPYIADFAGLDRKIVIELDGPPHNETRDAKRDAYLEGLGYTVLRFSNSEAASDMATTRAIILETLRAAPPPHPSPLPRKGRGKSSST